MPSVSPISREAGQKKNSKEASKPFKKNAPEPHHLSEEFVHDSDDGELGSSTENEEREQSPSRNSNGAASKTKSQGITFAVSISSDERQNPSESGGDEDSVSSVEEEKRGTTEGGSGRRSAQRPSVEALQRPPPPYEPPRGFEVASIGATSRASQLLSGASLKEKQIWYFTAPASVPISAVQEIFLAAASESKVALKYNGRSYGFVPDVALDKMYTKVLIPDGDNDGFRTSINLIDHVLHLQRIVKLPTATPIADDQASAVKPAKKPVRQQPEGLRMRFRPLGFDKPDDHAASISDESGSDHDPDNETENAPTIRRPKILPAKFVKDRDRIDVRLPSSGSDKQTRDGSKGSLKRKHEHGGSKKSKKR